MSREQAVSLLKVRMDGIGNRGYVYQFPKGHWDWASFDSPIGHDLRNYGMIRHDPVPGGCLAIRALQWEEISW